MLPARASPGTIPLLPPFPAGWYCVGWARDHPAGSVRPAKLAGQDIVIFRTGDGVPSVLDAFCPHLGAHMGYGGTVDEDKLRCPFHGFEYDTQGNCKYVPYGTKPPAKARARAYPVAERSGILLVYFDSSDQAPAWEIPQLDEEGWSGLTTREWTLRGHPQETTENSVDIGHFAQVHGYSSVETLKELVTDGPHLSTQYAAVRGASLLNQSVRAVFEIHAYGLGYSVVEVQVPEYGVRARLFVLATPLDGTQISLRIATAVYGRRDDSQARRLATIVPWPILKRVFAAQVFAGLASDVRQDFAIWAHKRYIQPPILAEGDGPIGKYRLWARQFYRKPDQSLV